MLNKEKILKIISKSLKVNSNKININSELDKLENWDSLVHLSILTDIDKHTNGKASRIRNLGSAYKVSQIYKILIKNKLAK